MVGIFMNEIMRGESMTVFGDGMQSRAFSHIDEGAPIIARSICQSEAYGHVFNRNLPPSWVA